MINDVITPHVVIVKNLPAGSEIVWCRLQNQLMRFIFIMQPSLGGCIECFTPSVCRPSIRPSVFPSHVYDFLEIGKP